MNASHAEIRTRKLKEFLKACEGAQEYLNEHCSNKDVIIIDAKGIKLVTEYLGRENK